MPEPVSTLGVIAGTAILSTFTRNDHSVSTNGEYLRSEANRMVAYAQQPISQNRYDALAELEEVVKEHSEEGWDGLAAPVVSKESVTNVKDFLRSLPNDIADPEFAVDPDDGAISLEWYGGYRKIVSVSINHTNRLAFATLNGINSSNGTYEYDGSNINEVILSSIQSII